MTENLLFELKAATTPQGIVEGIASPYGEQDAQGDVVMPGAFSDTLKKRLPAMLLHHDQSKVAGKWSEVRETDAGLLVRGQLALKTDAGREAYELSKADAVGLSIGFRLAEGGADYAHGARILKKLDLFEISFVGVPAAAGARLTGVKNLSVDITSPRTLESALREVGLSARQAKRLMSGGYRELLKTDEQAEAEELAEALRELNNLFAS
ncbi:HK97 family phage prohead protease [Thioalkalivibrio thiocyanodenitrificans]|uniref:HK97 family phage prohead protease n=1 Tax=Thioalkalivibrio thiocyanodenitrificans TaxID=243063 RepID=UPI00036B522E|nr:HK97 family phage prohead protease [Thioalkalivibrio thiocyanodenitrificans]